MPVPVFTWDSFRPWMDPAIVGAARIDGKHARVLSFSDPQAGRRPGSVCGSAKRGSSSRHRCGLKALQVRGVAGVAKEARYCIDLVYADQRHPGCARPGWPSACWTVTSATVSSEAPGDPSDLNEQAEELMGAVGRDDLAQAETGTFSNGTALTTPGSIRVKGQARNKEETRGDFTMRYASPSYDGPVCARVGCGRPLVRRVLPSGKLESSTDFRRRTCCSPECRRQVQRAGLGLPSRSGR